MISWRQSFKRLSEEYETASKKKRALDNLLADGRISQSTYDLFAGEICGALSEIEKQQQALQDKMNLKMGELADQVKTLEILLANFELQHVTGEVDEETYQCQIDVLSVGLETAKRELGAVKEAMDQLLKGDLMRPESEPSQTVVEPIKEELPEPVVEFVQISQTETSSPQQEHVQTQDEPKSTETEKVEEKQGA